MRKIIVATLANALFTLIESLRMHLSQSSVILFEMYCNKVGVSEGEANVLSYKVAGKSASLTGLVQIV